MRGENIPLTKKRAMKIDEYDESAGNIATGTNFARGGKRSRMVLNANS